MNHRSSSSLAGKPAEHTTDGPVAVTVVQHVSAPDAIRPIAKTAEEWGVEPKALLAAAHRAGVALKLGRQWCARRSDLLRLPELLAKPAPAPSSTDPRVAYAEMVGRKAGAR